MGFKYDRDSVNSYYNDIKRNYKEEYAEYKKCVEYMWMPYSHGRPKKVLTKWEIELLKDVIEELIILLKLDRDKYKKCMSSNVCKATKHSYKLLREIEIKLHIFRDIYIGADYSMTDYYRRVHPLTLELYGRLVVY